jgi:Transposase, Mutator family
MTYSAPTRSDGDWCAAEEASRPCTGQPQRHAGVHRLLRDTSEPRVAGLPIRSPEEMEEWSNRPLDPVYVAIFIDAIVVKVREGQVANRPVYAAIGSQWRAARTGRFSQWKHAPRQVR